MQRPTLLVAVLTTLSLTGCPGKPPMPEATTSTPATSTMQPTAASPTTNGSWTALSATMAGSPFPSELTKSISLVIKDGTYEVSVDGQPDKGTCQIDPSTTPPRITITSTEGPNVGKTILAIFDHPDEDQLRVCYNLKGITFPDTFNSTPENGYFLVTYQKTITHLP